MKQMDKGKVASLTSVLQLEVKWLVVIVVFISIIQVQARGFSQNPEVTLSYDRVEVGYLIYEIERQTGFSFLYNVNDIDLSMIVEVHAKNERLEDVLVKLFSNLNLNFSIADDQVVIVPKDLSSSKRKITEDTGQIRQEERKIRGVVTDKDGVPLAGVNITIEGTSRGTQTNFDGEYLIRVNDGDEVSFSFLGYETYKVGIQHQTKINVVLMESLSALSETVIVGYGVTNKKDFTGSVSSVSAEEINQSNPTTFENALIGRAAGVYVTPSSGAPGSAASIRIRGVTSAFGNNEPLYIIDGVPIEIGQGQGNDFYSQNYNEMQSPLASLNPQDIESIDILKDASATAIYGSRGANGVVVVTTKKGSYSSVPNISFNVNTSVSKFTNDYNILNSDQFHNIIDEGYNNVGEALPEEDLLFPYGKGINTNWKNLTTRNAVSTNYYLNATGGSFKEGTIYSLSASKTIDKGAIDFTEFKRDNLRSQIETKVAKGLKTGIHFNYSNSKNRGSNTSFYYQTVKYRPDIPVRDENGDFGHDTGEVQANPYAKVRYPSVVDNQDLRLTLYGEWEIINGLSFRSSYSHTKSDNKSFRYTPSTDIFEQKNNRKGTLNQSTFKSSSRIFDNTLTLNRTFKQHSINAVLGTSYTQNKSESEAINASNFPDDEVTVTPGAASSVKLTDGGTISGLESYFARVNYNYDEKYYLTFTGRADKSTKFGPKNQWGYFPSGAISWRLSKEDFLKDIESISDLKFRASYGKTGSANFSDFQYATFFAPGSFYNNHNGIVSNTIPNPAIKWETTNQLDVGLDFAMLDDRLNGSIEYFQKKTSDQILQRDVILETGGTTQFANIGDFLNRGFEFHIGYDVISNRDFQWTADFNISSVKSKVLKLNGGHYRNLVEGQPISYFSGYKIDGIFQSQDEIDQLNAQSPNGTYQSSDTAPGDFKYVDANGDGGIGQDDMTIIGKAEPDFYGGWNNTIRWKNFQLSALFNFSKGNYLYNMNKRDLTIFQNYNNNYSTQILNAWTPQNTGSGIPRVAANDPNNNRRDSDYFIEDASFFKLKNIYLSYQFDPKVLEKTFIDKATIYFSATNVFTITPYSGLDPEVNYSSANNFNQGYDSAAYPPVRAFAFGININL